MNGHNKVVTILSGAMVAGSAAAMANNFLLIPIIVGTIAVIGMCVDSICTAIREGKE